MRRFHAIQHAFLQSAGGTKAAGRLLHRLIHGQIVLRGGDQKIDFADEAVVIHLSSHGTACRAAPHTSRCPWLPVLSRLGAHMLPQQIGIVRQLFNALDGMQHFDEPRQVIVKRLADGSLARCLNSRISRSARGVPADRATFRRASGPTRYLPPG